MRCNAVFHYSPNIVPMKFSRLLPNTKSSSASLIARFAQSGRAAERQILNTTHHAMKHLTSRIPLSLFTMLAVASVPVFGQGDDYRNVYGDEFGFPMRSLIFLDGNAAELSRWDVSFGRFNDGMLDWDVVDQRTSGANAIWSWYSGGDSSPLLSLSSEGQLALSDPAQPARGVWLYKNGSITISNAAGSAEITRATGGGLAVDGQKLLTETAAAGLYHSKADADVRYLRTSGSGVTVLVFGAGSSGVGDGAVALGNNADADGVGATAMGKNAYALGEGATAIGLGSRALKQNAVAMGRNSIASGDWGAIALGCGSTASGEMSLAMGWCSFASGPVSAAIGSYTVASAYGSTALGQNTISSGQAALAAGYYSKAIGWGSLSVGDRTEARGDKSVAIGSNTIALGLNAVAIGQNTTASSSASAAFGQYTMAVGNSQFVVGSYNAPITDVSAAVRNDDDALFIVGNGYTTSTGSTVTTTKRNAFVVHWNGRTEIFGNVEAKASGTTSQGHITAAGDVRAGGKIEASKAGGLLVADTLEAKDGLTRLRGTVIIERQGDINMGEFVGGPQP